MASSISFWPNFCSDLETDGSSTSLKGRAGHPEESLSLSGNVEFEGAAPSLLSLALALCLLPQLPLSASLELGWNASALSYSFLQSFWCSQLGFGAQLSNVYLSRPHQAGDSNAANLAELGGRI